MNLDPRWFEDEPQEDEYHFTLVVRLPGWVTESDVRGAIDEVELAGGCVPQVEGRCLGWVASVDKSETDTVWEAGALLYQEYAEALKSFKPFTIEIGETVYSNEP